MSENPEQISKLLQKAEALRNRQEKLQQEIVELYSEILRLKTSPMVSETQRKEQPGTPEISAGKRGLALQPGPDLPPQPEPTGSRQDIAHAKPERVAGTKSGLERFIGENLINKIGIAVTVIGVGIGAKYAIDHQLISPWTRIILGYLVGLGLFGFAVRLKKSYKNFSAVLLSGAMAILYFITFAAYSFYDLIPLALTFILMVMFTVFTVAASVTYNRQVIAHIGLVGAYAVPFLLSDSSGRVLILFSYMAIINTGILIIAFKKSWKPLYYSSFLLTWLIFITWFIPKYEMLDHFGLALSFISIFFITFYLIFLADYLIRKEKPLPEMILLLLANSAIFYGLGYSILLTDIAGSDFRGLFTLGNALVHFAVAFITWLQKPADRRPIYYLTGLGLILVTIAIPVQLDGNWVTMLWAGEAALLFWIGRTKNSGVFELLSFPVMFIVMFSIMNDWQMYHAYDPEHPGTRVAFILNLSFLTSMLVVVSFGFIQYLDGRKNYTTPLAGQVPIVNIMKFCIPAILILLLFFSFYMEISTFWYQLYLDSRVTKNNDLTVPTHFRNDDLIQYRTISTICYSLLFFSILSFINMKWIKNTLMGLFNLGLNTVTLGVFLTLGLYAIGDLRDSFLGQDLSEFYYRGVFDIGIRYISFVFVALMLVSVYKYVRQEFLQTDFKVEFDFLLHITLLTLISNELINWMDLYQPGQSYKLGLSLLFGGYALLLVALGIWRKKTYLRISAIVLFAATLLKLFFYDLSYLDTISKTIVFVILGVLLLIISFLYNKYKVLIFEDRDDNK